MAVYWRLKQLLNAHDIPGAAQLYHVLQEELGLQVSPQALGKLLRKPPDSLKISTAQIICTLFQVPLQDYLVITPEPKIKNASIIQPYRMKPHELESLFVDPARFL